MEERGERRRRGVCEKCIKEGRIRKDTYRKGVDDGGDEAKRELEPTKITALCISKVNKRKGIELTN